MDVNMITSLIGSVGFPIVACGAMAWWVKYTTDQNNKEVEQMRIEHKEEVNKMTEALNNNTVAIQKLVDKIEMQCDCRKE